MHHLLKSAWDILVIVCAIAVGIAAADILAPLIFPWLRKPKQGRGPDRP